jgi:hypothetical protein
MCELDDEEFTSLMQIFYQIMDKEHKAVINNLLRLYADYPEQAEKIIRKLHEVF